MNMRTIFFIIFLTLCLALSFGQEVKYNTPQAGNPIIPGYFADPTIQKFGDTYYLYATTDGNGGGLGPSQVWTSKDFVNWSIQPMNWPNTHYIWAPDVMKGKDGKYYMYYCQPCQIYCGVSDTPVGPWKNILGEEEAVLVPDRYVKMSITLDGQTFVDDDGSVYLYWGTWGIYPNHGCGVGKLNLDMKLFSDTTLIPNTQITDFFEAPYVFKRNGIYYLTYSSGSCHDNTYRVQYATSKTGPMGPFTFADNNPILATNADETIHGPGHHSILKEGDDYYIVYHRHNIPQSTRGMHRQVAADRLVFDDEGRILKVEASHKGIGYLQKNTNPYPNLLLGKKVRASSYYNEDFVPEYAIDDNNATLWRPRTCGEEWIEVDLGKKTSITRVWTQFEHATSFYQYLIETSLDGKEWTVFSDRRANTQAGSPMMDAGKAKARYLRLTITGNEQNGLSGAIWNLKAFNGGKNPVSFADMTFGSESTEAAPQRKGLIFEINADDYPMKESISRLQNRKDKTKGFNAIGQKVAVRPKDNKSAFIFNGMQEFRSDFSLGKAFTGNSPYTLMAWIYMENISTNECIADLTNVGGELEKVVLGYGTDTQAGVVSHHGSFEDMGLPGLQATKRWTLLSVTFDGFMERIYLDGKLMKEKNVMLRLPLSDFVTIGKKYGEGQAFKNSMHSLALYDLPLTADEVADIYKKGIPDSPLLAESQDMNDLKSLQSFLSVRAVSSSIVRLGMKMDTNEFGLSFSFENLTTGKQSGWINDFEYFDTSLQPGKKYSYRVRVKDTFGNIKEFDQVEVSTDENQFQVIYDDFSKQYDFVKAADKKGIWDGLSGYQLDEVSALTDQGQLMIKSAGRNFQLPGRDNGPFLYKEVDGDFLAEVEIVDFSGMKEKKGVSFNEGGLMVALREATTRGGQELIHLGTFPYYNVGNILTLLSHGRIQYKNDKGWDLERFLQVERSGNRFYFRTSTDGAHWTNMPGSPIVYSVSPDQKIKLGLYQVTYTPEEGYVAFDNFKLWIAR